MLDYTRLKQQRRKLIALTGLTRREFEYLLPAFQKAYERRYPSHLTATGRRRKRQAGGGRQSSLGIIEQKLLFVLVYQKTYPLQVVLGEMFDMSQSSANEWLHRLLPILLKALDDLGVTPERDPQAFARAARRSGEPLDFVIDGTERRRQRPKNPRKQAWHYSKRKRAHTDKNVLIVNRRSRRVLYLSQTYPGRAHDKGIVDHEPIRYPRQARLGSDLGFEGYRPRLQEFWQPKKRPSARS